MKRTTTKNSETRRKIVLRGIVGGSHRLAGSMSEQVS
jgi:hypothetical protein